MKADGHDRSYRASHAASLAEGDGGFDAFFREQYDALVRFLRRRIRIQEDAEDAAQAMLASSLRQQGKVAEAGPYYRRAMEWNIERFGAEALPALPVRHNHANWLLSDGQPEAAAAEQRALLEIARSSFGETHHLTRHVLRELAEAELVLGRLDDARRNALAALEATREAAGENDGATRDVRETLAKIEAALGGSGSRGPVAPA